MFSGCYTAIITPFNNDALDNEGLKQLLDFQIKNGIAGIVAVGTTGESPTLSWNEHNTVIEIVARQTKEKCMCIAGAGSNNTKESMHAVEHAHKSGVDAILLVDPYYNGPSSLEIRKEYYTPIAEAFPDLNIIPYIIPGRTGAQMLPADLAILHKTHKNIAGVKEATGNLDNMKTIRTHCGDTLSILSGDDGMTFAMMTDTGINASGVISVTSNICPLEMSQMVKHLSENEIDEAKIILNKIEPLFQLVGFTTTEQTPYGDVMFRARNPLGIKTLMAVLGMPAGPCRQPLGKMTQNGIDFILGIARGVFKNTPEVFEPLSDHFNIDVAKQLSDPVNWQDLVYESY